LDEARKRNWDVGLGIAGPVITVIGILIGVWQYNDGERSKVTLQQDLIRQQDDIEFKRKLWLERLAAYRSVAEVAGKISANANDPKFGEYVRDFTAAYWGTMIFVEDDAVEAAMKAYYFELQDFQKGWSDLQRLKTRADLLIKACRKSAEQRMPSPVGDQPAQARPSAAMAAKPGG
jgi:hypothetical protein